MREIKFRGKANGNIANRDGWVYSEDCDNGTKNKACALSWFFNYIHNGSIDQSTVGQWTGLKDKNGVDIYEGDILSVIDPNGDKRDDEIVEYKNSSTAFTIEVETNDFDITTIGWAQGFDFVLEVIGNIHEVTK